MVGYSPWGHKELDMTEWLHSYKKDLQDPDNHTGVIIHLEADILECEVKLVQMMEFQLRYFKS